MTLLEKLLGQCLGDDLTETTFWTDGVYRALEQDLASEAGLHSAAGAETNLAQEIA